MTEKSTPRITTAGVAFAVLALMLLVYAGSFFVLSRAGIQRAESAGDPGYDFLDDSWSIKSDSRERMLEAVYYPLIEIDAFTLSGRRPDDPSFDHIAEGLLFLQPVP